MDTPYTDIQTTIGEIWNLFGSCCMPAQTFGDGSIQPWSFNPDWNRLQAYDAVLLQHYISHTTAFDTAVQRLVDRWTSRLVPMFLLEEGIYDEPGRGMLLATLREFKSKVGAAISHVSKPVTHQIKKKQMNIELSGVINEIWKYFRDFVSISGGERVVYADCDILRDIHWKETLKSNATELDTSFKAAPKQDINISVKKDQWVFEIISDLHAGRILIDTNTETSMFLTNLRTFRAELQIAMNNSSKSNDRAAVQGQLPQPVDYELHDAVNRLSNLFNQIYPAT